MSLSPTGFKINSCEQNSAFQPICESDFLLGNDSSPRLSLRLKCIQSTSLCRHLRYLRLRRIPYGKVSAPDTSVNLIMPFGFPLKLGSVPLREVAFHKKVLFVEQPANYGKQLSSFPFRSRSVLSV